MPLVLFVAACGTDRKEETVSDGTEAVATCEAADSSAAMIAVRDFIADAVPYPQRFLHAVGSDSAIPDDAVKVLQSRGPTFYWAGSDEDKARLRAKLENDGPFATLLVVMRAHEVSSDSLKEALTLTGYYIGNKDHGKQVDPYTFQFRCEDGRWRRIDNSPDPVQ